MRALQVSIVSSDEAAVFCRRLSALVNHTPMHLARVLETAVQVYPVRLDSITGQTTMRSCELRMRHAGAELSDDVADAVLARVRAHYEVTEARFVPVSASTATTASPTATVPAAATAA